MYKSSYLLTPTSQPTFVGKYSSKSTGFNAVFIVLDLEMDGRQKKNCSLPVLGAAGGIFRIS